MTSRIQSTYPLTRNTSEHSKRANFTWKGDTSIPVSYFSHVSPGIEVSTARSEKFSTPFCIFTSNLWRWNTRVFFHETTRGKRIKKKNNIKLKKKKKREGRQGKEIDWYSAGARGVKIYFAFFMVVQEFHRPPRFVEKTSTNRIYRKMFRDEKRKWTGFIWRRNVRIFLNRSWNSILSLLNLWIFLNLEYFFLSWYRDFDEIFLNPIFSIFKIIFIRYYISLMRHDWNIWNAGLIEE